jgi:hypothetical protein
VSAGFLLKTGGSRAKIYLLLGGFFTAGKSLL